MVHWILASRRVRKGAGGLYYHSGEGPNTLLLCARPWDDDALHPVAVKTVDSLESTFAQKPDRGSASTLINCTMYVDDAQTLGSLPEEPGGFG